MGPEIRTAQASDVPALAAALAVAFFDDPVMAWLLPDAETRQERLRRFFELELRLVGLGQGTVWTTQDHGGAAITTPPGEWRLPWFVAVRHGLAFTRAFGTRLPVASALLQRMEHRHLREPHYYIPYVGVVPERQGRGLGTQLMRPTLELCDERGLPVYLEGTSPRNVTLYQRLGFEILDELRLRDSPPLVRMRRPPAPRT